MREAGVRPAPVPFPSGRFKRRNAGRLAAFSRLQWAEGRRMRKVACFCDRCAVSADWMLAPSRRNLRFFDLFVSCHGESERFLVAASELLHARRNGQELASPLYVIAFEDERPSPWVRVIGPACENLSIRISNPTNRLAEG